MCVKQEPTQCFKSRGEISSVYQKDEKEIDGITGGDRGRGDRDRPRTTERMTGIDEQEEKGGGGADEEAEGYRSGNLQQCAYLAATLSHEQKLKACVKRRTVKSSGTKSSEADKVEGTSGERESTERPDDKG